MYSQEIPHNFSPDPRFHDNLALYLDDRTLTTIGNELVDHILDDIQDREPWRNIIREGLDYLGIGKAKPGGSLSMPQETNFYAPTLRKNALMMTSKLHQILFPPQNFVNTVINGFETEEAQQRAQRIEAYFNHYLRDVAKEYISDKKEAIYWCVLMGCVYSKTHIDPIKRRPVAPYINADNIILSRGANSFEDSERITHQFTLTERVLRLKQERGQYKKIDLDPSDESEEESIVQKASSQMGINNTRNDDKNKTYSFFETLCYQNLRGFEHLDGDNTPSGQALPYLVTVERNSRKVVSIYRNWEETDPNFERLNPLTQYKLFSGFGAYGMGLFHLLLDLAKAETKTLSELLKAAELSNQPALFQASGSLKQERTQIDFRAGSVNRIEAVDGNINNAITPLVMREPSQTLLALKAEISQAMTELSTVREITPQNIPSQTTATTMMGMISTMHILEDSVVNGFYSSFKNELSLFYNLFGKWLPDEPYPFSVPGADHAILRADFQPDIVIQPIVDPNISSHMLQLVTGDALNALYHQFPDLYDKKEVNKRLLKAMRVADIETLFQKPPEPNPPPPPRDPVSENKDIMEGKPVQVYKDQDHDSHNIVHNGLKNDLMSDQTQDQSQRIAALDAHILSHKTFKYIVNMEADLGFSLPEDPSQIPPPYQNQIAIKAAEVLQAKQKEEQALNPPPPDPATVMLEDIKVKQEGIQAKRDTETQKIHVEQQKASQEAQLNQDKMALEREKLELEKGKINIEQKKDFYKNKIEYAKLQSQEQEGNLRAQTQAFDSTLQFEKENQKAPSSSPLEKKKERSKNV